MDGIVIFVLQLFIRIIYSHVLSQPLLQLGAAKISTDIPVPSIDDLADQVAEVLDYFG